MHLYYIDVPSKYWGVGRGWAYNQKGTFWDPLVPNPPPPLVSQLPRVVSLCLEFDATSQVSWDEKGEISKSLQLSLVGIDVNFNQERAWSNSCDTFVYRTNDEIDGMSI